ncbi:hypothetical protein ACFLTR_03955, partial [Chloroflexota bacterium]
LLSFFLFLSLSIFGTVFMINNTLLKPDFVTAELNRLDVSSLVEAVLSMQTPEGESPEEFETALVNTITELEPLVKEQLSAAIYSIYDYLLGESQGLDLAATLRDTILSTDFVASLMDELDISSLAAGFLSEQLTEQIPEDMEFLVEHLDDAIAELEPTIKEELIAATDPVLDYLLGESQSLNIVISLEPIMENLKDSLREAFLESPPPELATIPLSMQDQYFEEFYQEFSREMPATFEIDESMIGTEVPANIAMALAEAERGLEEGRQYVSYFQLGYKALIGFMVLLLLGIILINRQVKDTTRRLGVPLVTYGAMWYAGVLVAKYFAGKQLALPEMPASLQTWITQFSYNVIAPLETFSLCLLIGGVALIVVSFVYKRGQPTTS